jgi:hypothetical protein
MRSTFRLCAASACLAAAPAAAQAPPTPAPAPPASAAAPTIVPDCSNRRTQEIVVCGRRGERSAFRLPPQPEGFDPDGAMPSVSRERHRLYEVGQTGIGSCTNVGPGGWTGCQFLHWRDEHHQRDGNGPVVSFGIKKNDPPRR